MTLKLVTSGPPRRARIFLSVLRRPWEWPGLIVLRERGLPDWLGLLAFFICFAEVGVIAPFYILWELVQRIRRPR